MRTRCMQAGTILAVMAIADLSYGDISVDYWFAFNQVGDYSPNAFNTWDDSGSGSLSHEDHRTLDVVNGLQADSIVDHTFDESAGVLGVDFDFSLQSADQYDHANSYGYVNFTAETNEPFAWSGAWDQTGTSILFLDSYFFDLTAGEIVWRAELNHSPGTDADADLGDALLSGSLTGDLIAGHVYQLYWDTYIQMGEGAINEDSSLDGFVRMETSPIPAPGAAELALVGFPLVGLMRRRKAD